MSLFEIGSQLEGVRVQLNRIDDLLSIFEESFEQELEALGAGDCWAKCVRTRCGRLTSLMETIQLQQAEAIAALNVPIDAVYSIHRENKANQKQT